MDEGLQMLLFFLEDMVGIMKWQEKVAGFQIPEGLECHTQEQGQQN